ncbi:DUF6578 domain-containing protein [Streptomyces sp. NPDC050636]|uniref:DUF6578 domain-containing protein n=1 Tax=Streptomyces sp. NPDC050636 TaxID=3154510 RepID=UPI003419EBE3
MELIVWVDNWQMQCCGDPFSIGSRVSWKLIDADKEWLADVVGAHVADRIDGAEEHHGGSADDAITEGTVTGISAVHCRYAPRPGSADRTRCPVPGSGTRTALTSADGWTPDHGELQFAGYLVELTGVRG